MSPLKSLPINNLLTLPWIGMLGLGLAPRLWAAPVVTPPQVQNLLGQFDNLASKQDLVGLRGLYKPEFKTSDGLDLSAYEKALQSLWERYPNLTYSTKATAWEQNGDRLMVQTQTTIKGEGKWQGNVAQLAGVIESRQTYVANRMVQQEILSEKITLTSGKRPPQVDIQLPPQVKPGQEFDFDVILTEPLGDNLVAGTAFAQPIQTSTYLKPLKVELELLQAGGLFKRAKAPRNKDAQWFSALLISSEGVTYVTQRLRIES